MLHIFCLNSLLSLPLQPWSIFDASSGSTQYTVKGDLSLMTSRLQKPKGTMNENSSQVGKSWISELLFGCWNFVRLSQLLTLTVDAFYLQLWHSFDDANGIVCAQPRIDDHSNTASISLSTSNPFMCSIVLKVYLFPPFLHGINNPALSIFSFHVGILWRWFPHSIDGWIDT